MGPGHEGALDIDDQQRIRNVVLPAVPASIDISPAILPHSA